MCFLEERVIKTNVSYRYVCMFSFVTSFPFELASFKFLDFTRAVLATRTLPIPLARFYLVGFLRCFLCRLNYRPINNISLPGGSDVDLKAVQLLNQTNSLEAFHLSPFF